MNLEHLLETYGYLALFIGTFAEGESVLLLGGFLAHRGHMELPAVIAIAFVAAVCGNQLYFYLGRRHAHGFLLRFPRLQAQAARALRRIENHQVKWTLAMRFMWGFRIAMPVALGMTNMRASLFFWLNLASGAFWAVLFAYLGYSTSNVLMNALAGIHLYEKWIAGILIAVALMVLALRWRRPAQR